MRYSDILCDFKVQSVLAEINEDGTVLDKQKFEKLSADLCCFHEVDNEYNRTTEKFYYITGTKYASALLYHCAEQGWEEPVSYLIQMGVDLLEICLYDSDCKPSKISNRVWHLFPQELFDIWNDIELK